jgi:hypothetical protein
MIRIILNIKNFSPFLQTVSGEVVVDWVDYRDISAHVKPILTCNFDVKPNQLGYTNVNGYDSSIFHALKPQIDTMIRSYKRGMTLAPHDFSWVEETKNTTLDIWKAEKVREYEASNEF